MSDPASYRPAPGTIPLDPGVYRFRDAAGRVVYVGKAKSLRQRLNSYFADVDGLHPRTRQMVTTAASVEWTVVQTEVEALQLEYSWIKQYDPRFNVKYRDDKSYPSLAVTVGEEFPRLQVMRGPKKRGVRYFGPYSHAWAIRETLDLLLRVFPARTCSRGVFVRAGQVGRPCLLGYIDKCSAPCVGKVSAEEHRAIVDDFCDFLAGQSGRFVKRLERDMADAAEAMEYERAARLRDDVGALKRALEKQAVVLGDGTDADVVGVVEDQLEAAIQVFHVRGGRVRGQHGYVVDKVEDLTTGELVGQFLAQAYGDDPEQGAELEPEVERRDQPGAVFQLKSADDVPREVLVPALPPDAEALTAWLAGLRGTNVDLRVPQRGDKKALMDTVTQNARQAFALHKTRRASDLTARSQALAEIQEALGLDDAPLRIECFDVSHTQGTGVVASMVVFEDGLARKSEYRRFSVRGTDGVDDTASMREVVRRRFARHLEQQEIDGDEGARDETGRARRFAYPPQLVVVDGGQPQVAAAQAALDELGVVDVALCGLAKRLEEVWLPGDDEPVILPRTSEGLYLLQRVRDEAHRFAITYHRQKRSKSMVESALDDVPGLGETRRKAVLKHFGSLKRLREASVEDLVQVPGLGRRTAEAIVGALAPQPADDVVPAFDPATGEVVELVALDLVVVTGLSGAGRSTAAKCLEDLGWFVVDNLPPSLLPTMVDLGSRSQGAVDRIAVVVDVRSRGFSSDLRSSLGELGRDVRPRVLFLEASDDALVRRFEAVRRPHPLQGADRLVDGIARERELLRDLRGEADLALDTTLLNVHELRRKVVQAFSEEGDDAALHLTVLSFGFKYGLPVDADLVADMRFLPNPHWVPELRPKTGRDPEVSGYVLGQPDAAEFLDRYEGVVRLVFEGYAREGKRYALLAVGCTGGKHRSVATAEALAARLAGPGTDVQVVHRDLGRE